MLVTASGHTATSDDKRTVRQSSIPDDADRPYFVTWRERMEKPVLAVGVDPAKRLHRAVAVLLPDEVVLDVELPNAINAVANLDDQLFQQISVMPS